MDIDYYLKINNLYGAQSKKETIIYNQQKYIGSLDFNDDLRSFDVLFSNNQRTVLIMDSHSNPDKKKILGKPHEQFKSGDVFTWNNINWIITDVEPNEVSYPKGYCQICYGNLKWLDSNGFLRQTSFTYKADSASNFGVDYGRIIATGNERRNLLIPLDDATKNITKGYRFIFDSRAWVVTSLDTINMNGLVSLTVEEKEINLAVDNLELEVADYVGKVADFKIEILNGAAFSTRAGLNLQLRVKVTNRGEVVTAPLLYSSSNTSIAIISDTGQITTIANGTCIITVKLTDYPNIRASINGTVQFSVQDNYTVELLEDAYLLKNTTKTFTAIVKNNGVIDPSKFISLDVFSDDKTSTTNLVTIISNSTTQITFKGNISGYVQLRARIVGLSGDHWIRVQIRGLI